MPDVAVTEHGHQGHGESMLSVEEALERILDFFDVLDAEDKPLLDTLGQVLAEDVVSRLDIPPMDNSGMDGYAVQADSVRSASTSSPIVLRVSATVAAGQLPKLDVTPGTAVRIMTGAPLPRGADAVVPFENTDEVERKASGKTLTEIGVKSRVVRAANVRPAGQDVGKGDQVFAQGTVLRPAEIGVLASLGYGKVRVVRRPRVAILATGDELVELGEEHAPGKIYDSNSYGLAAAVASAGGIPTTLGIAGDNVESIRARLHDGLRSDMLLTSAGVSRGDYDVVKEVLARYGKIQLWSVRMRPAKPLAFGLLDRPGGGAVPHLGLPGNPVSALVGFEQFGRAAVNKMLGKGGLRRPTVQAVLEERIDNPDGRRVYARAVVSKRDGVYYARLSGHQSSNILTSMARANGLAICPEDVPSKEPGDAVEVQMLDWPEAVF